jgi:hypothetical protein
MEMKQQQFTGNNKLLLGIVLGVIRNTYRNTRCTNTT